MLSCVYKKNDSIKLFSDKNNFIEMNGTISINDDEIHYRSHLYMGRNVIVSYLTDYEACVIERIKDIARIVYTCREDYIIPYNSLCECNKVAERLAIRMDLRQSPTSVIVGQHVTKGKILLRGGSMSYNKDDVHEIFGCQKCIMGASFHALAYVTFHLNNHGSVHIAIDGTTSSRVDTYFANMLVAPSIEELEQLAKIRYQYEKFDVVSIYHHPDK